MICCTKDWLGVVSRCIMGMFLGRYRDLLESLSTGQSKGVFVLRTLTGSEVFFILKLLDATKFVFLSVFTIIETICSKIWVKPPSKNEKTPLPVEVSASLKMSLLKLTISYWLLRGCTENWGKWANSRPQKLLHDAITHKTAKWPKETYYYTFPIRNWIQRTCVVG